ncbi:S-layer homology domain-containing protein [Neglectibacter timonensis]|uniref:S-layer homology domain-containing protein n=1 Tax=Neglectibacter timonensis TaxID=1776382 RepID=UPI00321BA529
MKKLVSLLLSLLLLGTSCFAAAADRRSAPWYGEALEHAVENGLLMGDEEGLSPEKNLTRAQLAAILGRAFSAQQGADLSSFADVSENAWYYEDMAKAVRMGIFQGDGNRLLPDSPATREEVFAVLARCFQLRPQDGDVLTRFADGEKVSFWAREAAQALVSCGYIQGSGNSIEPQKSITRAEFAQVMDRMVQNYCSAGGIYSEFPKGNVVINQPGISLQGVVIEGDLILADGVGENDIDLSGVTVTGRILVRGGNLTAREGTAVPVVQVANPNGSTRIASDGSTEVKTLAVESPVVLSGKAGTVEARGPLTIEAGASVEELVLSSSAAQAEIHGTVDHLVTSAEAEGVEIIVPAGGSVAEAVVEAPGVIIAGEGSLGKVTANADGLHVGTPNTQLVVGETAAGVTVGEEKVEPGSSVTTNSTGTGVQETPPAPPAPSRVSVTGIEVEPETLLLKVQKTAGLTAKIQPANATEQGVAWSSSDEDVAVVDDQGQVTGVSTGSAVITATSKEGNFTAECTVTVEGAKNWYVNGVDGSDENDGLTSENAVQTIQHALEKAWIGDNVVICGTVSLGTQGSVTKLVCDKSITFTSKVGTEDYTASAELKLEDDIILGGPTTFRDIHINIVRTMGLYANGHPLVFDEGVVTHDLAAEYIAGRSLYVFGGGLNEDCGSTSVTVRSGRIHYLFGGGKVTQKDQTAKVNGDASITITGGYVDDSIVGGGDGYAANTNVDVAGKSIISISGQDFDMGWYDVNNNKECGSIYGGSWPDRDSSGRIEGGSWITMEDCSVFCDVFGGGHSDDKNSDVTVKGATIQLDRTKIGDFVFGGGMSFNSGDTNTIDGNVTITMTDCEAAAVIGGGASLSGCDMEVNGDVSITLTRCKLSEAIVGGGCIFDSEGSSHVKGKISLDFTDVTGPDGTEVPEILCSGMNGNTDKGTENASSDMAVLNISGVLKTQKLLAGETKNGCTVTLGSDASLQLKEPDDLNDPSQWPWYDSTGTGVVKNVDTLQDASFIWTDDRWVQQ